uniref:Uncharacterized protein n=1 Tax=Globodera rostochiensis TaxID=31243 RepID=A0A914I5P0_GLORO
MLNIGVLGPSKATKSLPKKNDGAVGTETWPSLKSPSSLVLIAALLFNCYRCCPADVLSLQDNACAKKGAGLPTGFSLPKDDQLLMEPWALGTDDINQPIQSQIHALLSNVEESAEPLHFSIIIIERDQKTKHGTCSHSSILIFCCRNCQLFVWRNVTHERALHLQSYAMRDFYYYKLFQAIATYVLLWQMADSFI